MATRTVWQREKIRHIMRIARKHSHSSDGSGRLVLGCWNVFYGIRNKGVVTRHVGRAQ